MLKRILGPAAPPPVFQPSWGPVTATIWVFVIYFGTVFAVFVGELLGLIVATLPNGKSDVRVLQWLTDPPQIALTLIVASRLRSNPLDVLALRLPANTRRLIAIILAIVATVIMVLLVIATFAGEDEDDSPADANQKLNEATIRSAGVWESLLLLGLLGPVKEELMFRGLLLLSFFNTRLWFWGGAVISSLLFALAHNLTGNVLVHAPYFVMGLGCAAALRFTGSLWVPIGMHIVKNAIAVLLLGL